MLKALDEYKTYLETYCMDEDEAEEYIIHLYLAVRLRPLLNKAGINANRLNNICSMLVDQYLDYEISLDIMINAIYNYINATKTCPSDKLLSDDIEAFLKEYAEE